jgi:hypothetical protein
VPGTRRMSGKWGIGSQLPKPKRSPKATTCRCGCPGRCCWKSASQLTAHWLFLSAGSRSCLQYQLSPVAVSRSPCTGAALRPLSLAVARPIVHSPVAPVLPRWGLASPINSLMRSRGALGPLLSASLPLPALQLPPQRLRGAHLGQMIRPSCAPWPAAPQNATPCPSSLAGSVSTCPWLGPSLYLPLAALA